MNNQPKPLIVVAEDEKDLAELIATQLETAGMQAQVCNEASHVARFLKNNFANLLLLDVHLPDSSGFNLMDELRRGGIEIPVIFLTGENAEVQKVKALEMGGDDYITKPFSFPELIARIHAVLRRAETAGDANITKNATTMDQPFEFCGAEVNPGRLEVSFPDGEVERKSSVFLLISQPIPIPCSHVKTSSTQFGGSTRMCVAAPWTNTSSRFVTSISATGLHSMPSAPSTA